MERRLAARAEEGRRRELERRGGGGGAGIAIEGRAMLYSISIFIHNNKAVKFLLIFFWYGLS